MADPCQCEHGEHFDGGPGHDYAGVPAGKHRASYVGPICDECAREHMADYLEPDDASSAG